jgi:membrane-bound lytic murein transglycosylase F
LHSAKIKNSIILIFFSFSLFLGCEKTKEPQPSSILNDILKTGEITVITRNNANCYYLYHDQQMGFEYDLAKAFADFLGVKLNVNISEKWEGMIPALLDGKGHFIAASFTLTPERGRQVAFSNGYMAIQQHIIVHKNNLGIQQAEDLAGRYVHTRRGTSYQKRLEELKKQGIDLKMVLYDDLPTEELIRQVAESEIEVTIADSNIGLLNRRYYPQAVVAGPISEKEYLGWAVHRNADKLLEKINLFFQRINANGEFAKIYGKYYKDVDIFDYVDLRTFHRRLKTRLPRYRRMIQEAASKHGFDWRLIAAQIYQESHFNPKAKSPAGASGLMQLTPSTAKSLGVEKIFQPASNIEAGVQHLKNLYDHFDKAKGRNRMFIALAAYNIGQGHVWDARKIARSMNLDPNQWSSLKKTLPLLRYRKYNKNTKFGYCRGTEPVKYVKQILIYYDILRRQAIEYKTVGPQQKERIDT